LSKQALLFWQKKRQKNACMLTTPVIVSAATQSIFRATPNSVTRGTQSGRVQSPGGAVSQKLDCFASLAMTRGLFAIVSPRGFAAPGPFSQSFLAPPAGSLFFKKVRLPSLSPRPTRP